MTATAEKAALKGSLLVLRIGARVAKKAEIEGWTNVTPNESGSSQILARLVEAEETPSVTYAPGNIAAMELAEITPASGTWKSLAEAIPLSGTNPINSPAVNEAPTPTLSPTAEALLLAVLGEAFSSGTTTVNAPFAIKTSQGGRSLFTADASGAAGAYTCTFTLETAQVCQAGMVAVVNPTSEEEPTFVGAAARLEGGSTLTAAVHRVRHTAAALSADSSLTARGRRSRGVATSLVADSALTSRVQRVRGASTMLVADSVLSAAALRVRTGSAALMASASFSARAVRLRRVAAVLAATARMTIRVAHSLDLSEPRRGRFTKGRKGHIDRSKKGTAE